jgi:hypothetical protein
MMITVIFIGIPVYYIIGVIVSMWDLNHPGYYGLLGIYIWPYVLLKRVLK